MEWRLTFKYDPNTGDLTIVSGDGIGDIIEYVSLGSSCPRAILSTHSGSGAGMKLVIPNWAASQRDIRLVRVIDLLGPNG